MSLKKILVSRLSDRRSDFDRFDVLRTNQNEYVSEPPHAPFMLHLLLGVSIVAGLYLHIGLVDTRAFQKAINNMPAFSAVAPLAIFTLTPLFIAKHLSPTVGD